MIAPPSNLAAAAHLIKAFSTSWASLSEGYIGLDWTVVMDFVTQH